MIYDPRITGETEDSTMKSTEDRAIEYVARGEKYLDKRYPGWRGRVYGPVRTQSSDHCVIAQITGSYYNSREDHKSRKWQARRGFNTWGNTVWGDYTDDGFAATPYHLLDAEWNRVVENGR